MCKDLLVENVNNRVAIHSSLWSRPADLFHDIDLTVLTGLETLFIFPAVLMLRSSKFFSLYTSLSILIGEGAVGDSGYGMLKVLTKGEIWSRC